MEPAVQVGLQGSPIRPGAETEGHLQIALEAVLAFRLEGQALLAPLPPPVEVGQSGQAGQQELFASGGPTSIVLQHAPEHVPDPDDVVEVEGAQGSWGWAAMGH